jgi:hypothetical protein
MEYAYILSLIDEHLDHLTKARQILATLDTPQVTPERPAPRAEADSKARRTADKPGSSAAQTGGRTISSRRKATTARRPATAALAQAAPSASVAEVPIRWNEPEEQETREAPEEALRETVTPHLVDRVPTRRRMPASKKLPAEPPARALGGPVPTAPIFIPAIQVVQERSQRQAESASASEGGTPGATTPVTLTAELLARRWVQGLAS